MPFTTRANSYSPTLSQNRFGVATIVNEKHKKVWNVTKSIVPLQCQKSTNRLATDKENKNSINNLNKRKEKNYGNNTSSNEGTGLQGS